jgi:hypothetical protein
MISSNSIANDIFKILKGSGASVQLFTDEGDNTVDPEQARRFYMKETGSMVNLDETDSKREIRVSVNRNTDLDEFKDTLFQLKNLANRSIIEYTLKSFTKHIEPKDQDYQAQKVRDMKIDEGISPAWGTSKSSYQKLESAKLIIKHTKPVNEESRGSRSRNISAIYIENAEGERTKMPTNNLAGGRAMLRHVQEGGTPYDEFGQYIQEQTVELKKLKEFANYSKRNGLVNEDTAEIVEAVSQRIASIREGINKLKGCKCYHETKEQFEAKEVKINETDRNKLRNQFTVRTFDENIDSALPYVNALVKEMKAIKERDEFAKETLDNLVNTIIGMDKVRLRKGVDVKSDPENPMGNTLMRDKSIQTQLGAAASYLAGAIDGGKDQDQLAVLLSRFDDEVDNIKDGAMLKKAVLAIKTLLSKMKAEPASEGRVPSEDYEQTFESAFNKYDFNKLFS